MEVAKVNYFIISLLTMFKIARSYIIEKTKDYKEQVVKSIQNREFQFNAWYLVLIGIILALGATVFLGLMVWCVVNGHGSFTGMWKAARKGYIYAKCSR